MLETKIKILVVDDERAVLDILTEGLESTGKFSEIHAARNGMEAVEILNSHPIDVLVTDLKMPEMNGFELLAHVNNHFAHIPTIVISSYTSIAVQSKAQTLGILRFISKPIRLRELNEVIQEVADFSRQREIIRGISLGNFLQLISAELRTCALSVTSVYNKTGVFYFRDGVLIDAVCGQASGEEAAIEMLTWSEPEFMFQEGFESKMEPNIEADIMALLMEATRLLDEGKANRGEEQLEGIIGAPGYTGDSPREPADTPALTEADARTDSSGIDHDKRRENRMNTAKLRDSIETLKNDLGEGLLATDIFSRSDGQAIVGFNSQPAACALFAQLTNYIMKSLTDSDFPGIGRYYLLDLVDRKAVVILPLGEYIWGMLVDTQRVPIGLVLNVAVPKVISVYEEAVVG